LVDDLKEPPELEALERCQVDTMLHFPWQRSNFYLINFDHIFKDANMREILGYWISEKRFPFDKKGKSKTKKNSGAETVAPKQDTPNKGKEKKQGAPDKGKKKVQGFSRQGGREDA
jgi:hypothetical protein